MRSVEYFSRYVARNSCFLRDIGVLQYTGDIIEQIISTEHKSDSFKTVVSDIDLLILAETSTVYDQYAENVRKENQHLFSHISDYKKGDNAVFRKNTTMRQTRRAVCIFS